MIEHGELILLPARAGRALSLRAGRAPSAASCSCAWRASLIPGLEAEQLLLAPQELRTADPSFATEIYNGHFGLAGSLAELGSQSPFEITPPSEGWARELYGFGWLRHLRVAGSELSREQAKALLGDFLKLHKTVRGLAWQPEVVGRRVISWLSNSVVVLDAGNPKSYETFLHSLTAHLRYLSASYRDAPDGVPRLVALMALIYGGLCIAEQQAVVDRYPSRSARSSSGRSSPTAVISRATQRHWSTSCSISCRSGNVLSRATGCRPNN